jgi:hypothetical protein
MDSVESERRTNAFHPTPVLLTSKHGLVFWTSWPQSWGALALASSTNSSLAVGLYFVDATGCLMLCPNSKRPLLSPWCIHHTFIECLLYARSANPRYFSGVKNESWKPYHFLSHLDGVLVHMYFMPTRSGG